MIRNRLPDPDGDPDRHQNVIGWSLGHTPALHKNSSKSVGNFFDNPVNADFGFRTPGSEWWSGSSPKLNSLVPGPCPTSPKKFRQNPFTIFSVIRRINRQTDRQTDRSENITSFGGGKLYFKHTRNDDTGVVSSKQQKLAYVVFLHFLSHHYNVMICWHSKLTTRSKIY